MFFNQAESSSSEQQFKPEGLAYLASKGSLKLPDKNSVSNDHSDMFLQKIGETFEDDILSYEI